LLRTVTLPDGRLLEPATMRSRVDLPQPEAPIMQTNSPAADGHVDARRRLDLVVADRKALW